MYIFANFRERNTNKHIIAIKRVCARASACVYMYVYHVLSLRLGRFLGDGKGVSHFLNAVFFYFSQKLLISKKKLINTFFGCFFSSEYECNSFFEKNKKYSVLKMEDSSYRLLRNSNFSIV